MCLNFLLKQKNHCSCVVLRGRVLDGGMFHLKKQLIEELCHSVEWPQRWRSCVIDWINGCSSFRYVSGTSSLKIQVVV